MDDYKTMLEVSKALGVSKDVVKYHKKTKLDISDWREVGGKVFISPQGIAKIKQSLRKPEGLYAFDFEEKVIGSLNMGRLTQEGMQRQLFDLQEDIAEMKEKLDEIYQILKSAID